MICLVFKILNLRQPCPQGFLAFTLKQKDGLGMMLDMIEWGRERHLTDKRCNDVLLMLETTFFDH